jgi:hypothetical protein
LRKRRTCIADCFNARYADGLPIALRSMSAVTTTTNPDFDCHELDAIEVDFDEMDNLESTTLNAAKQITARTSVGPQFGRKKKTTGRSLSAKGRGDTATNGPGSATANMLPLRLPPFQKLNLVLTLSSRVQGVISGGIRVQVENGEKESEIYQLLVTGNVQPPLSLFDKKIDFGLCAVHEHKVFEYGLTF